MFLAGFLALCGLAGCANFWQAPATATSGGCTTNCTTASSGNFYILNSSTNGGTSQVIGESIVAGKLTELTGSPYSVPSTPFAMAIDPTGSYLYVSTQNGIYLYTVTSSTGVLSTTPTLLGFQDIQAQAIAVDPTGSWLLDASLSGNLYAIPLNSSGLLDTTRLINSQPPSQPLGATTAQQGGIAIAPSSQLISVAIGSTGTVLFPFTAANASPIGTAYSPVIHPYTTSGASVAVAFDPQSRYLYVGETAAFPNATSNTGGLRAFSIGSGSLTEFSYTAPYASGGTSPFAIQPKSTGDYVYVANGEGSGTGNITGFQVITTGTSPSLSAQGSPATAGTVPAGLAEDNTKTFLLEVNKNGSPYLDTYTFDASTAGLLDVQIVANTGATPIAIVAAPL